MKIRGGSGLGDSVYLRPIVDHLIKECGELVVMSNHPDVFIGAYGVTVEPVDKSKPVNVIAHYSTERFNQRSNQWQDILKTARLPMDMRLKFAWQIENMSLIQIIREKADGAPVLLVHGGRAPFGRDDGYGQSLMPTREAFESVLGVFGDCFTVRIGQGYQYPLPVSMDLTDKTTVSDLIDMSACLDGVITQCGFPIPMAEVFDKPVLGVWSSEGLSSVDKVIRSITPAKIFCKPKNERFIQDSWPVNQIKQVASDWGYESGIWQQEMQCAS